VKLESVFESGMVYADKWPVEVREKLNVPDPLAGVVVDSLQASRIVVITGNAGDGKSHLAQVALANLPTRSCHQVRADAAIPPDDRTIVFIRDASALEDETILGALRQARAQGNPALLTINEGPLASLAEKDQTGFFAAVRGVLHRRELGQQAEADADVVLINLAGRQLAASPGFVSEVLKKVLANVSACPTCRAVGRTCPRQVGAKMLKASRIAQGRVAMLLKLASGSGGHLTARDIWTFVIDLFYGHVCSQTAPSDLGYFWTRLFEDETPLVRAIRADFDPLTVSLPSADVKLWLGDWSSDFMGCEFPGDRPVNAYREDSDSGLRAFASAKRAYFMFAKDNSIELELSRRSEASGYAQLLDDARANPGSAVRTIVKLINQNRLASRSEAELWISRHHGMSANRRVTSFAATSKVDVADLEILVPFSADARAYPDAWFHPDRLFLKWANRDALLEVDFATWIQLARRRNLAVDRQQELLDFALDVFMSQAPVRVSEDPEVQIYDHVAARRYVIRARRQPRSLEVL
jgi:hypothetical protein